MKHSSNKVKIYYEEWTEQYLDSFGNIFQALLTENPEDLILYIGETIGIKDGMKLLDAGCGVCGPASILAKHYHISIDAITISSKQVKYSNKLLMEEELQKRVKVLEGDFHNLEEYYSRECYDVIYYLESLSHSQDPEKAITAASNIVKLGGKIYIKDLFRGPDVPSDSMINDYPINAINNSFCLNIRKVGEILDLLGHCGFKLIFCRRPQVKENFDRGNSFTAKHNFKLLKDQKGPWVDEGLVFLNWLEILAYKHYN